MIEIQTKTIVIHSQKLIAINHSDVLYNGRVVIVGMGYKLVIAHFLGLQTKYNYSASYCILTAVLGSGL